MRRIIFDVKQCMSSKAVLQITTLYKKQPNQLNFERKNRSFGWEKLTFSPISVSCIYTNDYHYSGCQFLSHAYDD